MPSTHERQSYKVALVTGAASGIGEATARVLAAEGYRLVLVDRSPRVQSVADSFEHATAVQRDLGSADSAEIIVQSALSAHGRIDALVNNAGLGGANLPVSVLTREDIQPIFDVNLFSMIELCREAGPALIETRGAIVNVGSLFAEHPVRDGAIYSMSKAAVHNLTRVQALELGPVGVRVNAVAPGYILTDMHLKEVESQAQELGVTPTERLAALRAEVPLGRHGVPEDIADTVAWLLSSKSRYVHGQIIAVNGGLTFT